MIKPLPIFLSSPANQAFTPQLHSKYKGQLATDKAFKGFSPRLLLAGLLLSVAATTGCQPVPQGAESDPQSAEGQVQSQANINELDRPTTLTPTPAAQAQIDKYESKFVAQMLSLQQRLQAEYESLQAADSPNAEFTTEDATPSSAPLNTEATGDNATNVSATGPGPAHSEGESAENFSTAVGERDLTVLKKISLEPKRPEILDESQIRARYQQAFAALFSVQALSAQEIDTLLNITTLLPDLFEQPQLAQQLSEKSPALARLVVQHQIWRQIEAQQVKDMQQMKREQQAEFEALMVKFNDTIKEYDEQIAKYEDMLKEFER